MYQRLSVKYEKLQQRVTQAKDALRQMESQGRNDSLRLQIDEILRKGEEAQLKSSSKSSSNDSAKSAEDASGKNVEDDDDEDESPCHCEECTSLVLNLNQNPKSESARSKVEEVEEEESDGNGRQSSSASSVPFRGIENDGNASVVGDPETVNNNVRTANEDALMTMDVNQGRTINVPGLNLPQDHRAIFMPETNSILLVPDVP